MVKVADQASNLASRAEENNQCIIHIFGGEMTTASFAMYTFSLAVLVQALSLISFSSVADYGKSQQALILLSGAHCF
jgi:MFS transporter, UMF1 family